MLNDAFGPDPVRRLEEGWFVEESVTETGVMEGDPDRS